MKEIKLDTVEYAIQLGRFKAYVYSDWEGGWSIDITKNDVNKEYLWNEDLDVAKIMARDRLTQLNGA